MKLSKEEVKELITSKPIQEGGFPKWMFEDSIEPTIDLYEQRLLLFGVKITYEKVE